MGNCGARPRGIYISDPSLEHEKLERRNAAETE
jgi:hypothetical protein